MADDRGFPRLFYDLLTSSRTWATAVLGFGAIVLLVNLFPGAPLLALGAAFAAGGVFASAANELMDDVEGGDD